MFPNKSIYSVCKYEALCKPFMYRIKKKNNNEMKERIINEHGEVISFESRTQQSCGN